MASETVDILLRLRNQRQFAQGAQQSGKAIGGVGRQADQAGKAAGKSGSRFSLLKRNMDGSRKSAGLFARGLQGLRGAVVGAIGALGVVGLGGALRTVVGEWREAQKANAETAAVLKSTGGVANVSAKGIAALSTRISGYSGVADDAIQRGANMLLTFKDIRNAAGKGNDIFDQSTATMADVAVKFGTDMPKAAVLLGKALNDPTKGLTALTKQGVTFTEKQKAQISALQESGDMMGAQKIILKELNSEFGGIAKSQADPFDKLKVSAANLAETIGFAVGPSLAKGADAAAKFINQMSAGTGAGGRFVDKLRGIWQWGSRNATTLKRVAIGAAALVVSLKAVRTAKKAIDTTSDAIKGIKAAARGTRRVGTYIVDNILPGLRGSPAKIRRALQGAQSTIKRALGRAGTVGGNTAANTAANSMGASIGPDMKKKQGRFTAVGRGAGKAVGIGIVAGVILGLAGLAGEIEKALTSAIDKATGSNFGAQDSIPANPSGRDFTKDLLGKVGIPGFATGGVMMRSGPAVVGERGPELLNLPARTQITPLESGRGEPRQVALSGGGRGQDIAREIVAALRKEPLATYIDGRLVTAGVARHATNARARQ